MSRHNRSGAVVVLALLAATACVYGAEQFTPGLAGMALTQAQAVPC